MREAKFRRFSAEVAAELETRFNALGDEDREALGDALGATARVLRFLSATKSPDLAAAGALVWRLVQAGMSLAAPVVGVGKEEAERVIASQWPELAKVAPTVAAVLRGMLPAGGAA